MKKKKSSLNKWFETFIVLDVLAISCLFIVYGPWDRFRNFWITTAMRTATHQYLAKVFYSESTIIATIKNNYVSIIDENTDTSAIVFSESIDTGVYESIYEEQILKRDEGNDLYKTWCIAQNKC